MSASFYFELHTCLKCDRCDCACSLILTNPVSRKKHFCFDDAAIYAHKHSKKAMIDINGIDFEIIYNSKRCVGERCAKRGVFKLRDKSFCIEHAKTCKKKKDSTLAILEREFQESIENAKKIEIFIRNIIETKYKYGVFSLYISYQITNEMYMAIVNQIPDCWEFICVFTIDGKKLFTMGRGGSPGKGFLKICSFVLTKK